MTYRTVLVSLNVVGRAEAVLDVAVAVAKAHDAHLIGLYAVPALQIYPSMSMQVTPEIVDDQRRYFQEQAKKVQAVFDETMRREGVSAEWRVVDSRGSTVADSVIDRARSVDLVIASQADDEEVLADTELCERLLMESGRPVLFVPTHGSFTTVGTSVAMAWNASQEATRAAFDALPMLKRASSVVILAVDPLDEEGREGIVDGTELAGTLARHGVEAELHRSTSSEVSVGDEVLSRISDMGADLLVMGGYGHSRMREFVFGGVTRQILTQMTVPVLMSH